MLKAILLTWLVCACILMCLTGCVPTERLETAATLTDFPVTVVPSDILLPPLTLAPTIAARLPGMLVSGEQARNLYWSDQEYAFVFSTWSSEQQWLLNPETGDIHPYVIAEPQDEIDEVIWGQLQILGDAPYNFSPDGSELLYHRQSTDGLGVELWFADLDNMDTRFVLTTTMQFDALSWFENIVWCLDGREALLTRTVGESIQIWRFDVASGRIADWYESLDQASQDILRHIAPTHIAIAPDSRRLAVVAWSQSPNQDRLWLADLAANHIELVGPAYAGAVPLWSPNGRYIYFINGDQPHYFGSFDAENPVGVSRFDTESRQTIRLVQPGLLGNPNFRLWAISSDERYILYSASGSLVSRENGIWLKIRD